MRFSQNSIDPLIDPLNIRVKSDLLTKKRKEDAQYPTITSSEECTHER